MTDDSANKSHNWPPMDFKSLATRLGVVTALGFGYWHAAAFFGVRLLGHTYDAPHVVSTAMVVPTARDLYGAVAGLIVTVTGIFFGWRFRSITQRHLKVYSFTVYPIVFVFTGLVLGWWFALVLLGLFFVGLTVVVLTLILGRDRLPLDLPFDHPKWDRYHAVGMPSASIVTGLVVAVGLNFLPEIRHPVVVPDIGKVVILRSDSVGHFALDDDGQLMWLSRSKVDIIMAVPKSDDDTTASENP